MDYVLIVILGLVIGSFLNVCIYRIPKEESVVYPPSHCTNCNHKLGPLDLIPVISYLFLGGKCRYCKLKISPAYMLVEIFNGIIYVFLYLKYGFTIDFVIYCLLVSLLIVISIIDYKTQFIYTKTTIFGVFIGVIFVLIKSVEFGSIQFDYIVGSICAFLIIELIVKLTKAMGEGDAEIVAICGLVLGVKGSLLMLFLSVVIGGIVASFILILGLKKARDKIAFGPFIAIGTIISLFFKYEILNWYFNLFSI